MIISFINKTYATTCVLYIGNSYKLSAKYHFVTISKSSAFRLWVRISIWIYIERLSKSLLRQSILICSSN
jgi:hypothetical protein